MNHTPGPWNRRAFSVFDSEGNIVASAQYNPRSRENSTLQMEPNANLIAAAPALLEACLRIVRESSDELPPTLSAIEQCSAAIAKATYNPSGENPTPSRSTK